MKKTYSILCAFVLAGSFFGCSTTQQKTSETDYTQYVNTFIGAADNGHTFPGACRPFSMIQTSPVTGAIGWRYCSEYVYTDSLIWGFTQTHLNGTGCMDLGDILVMPVTGTRKPISFASTKLRNQLGRCTNFDRTCTQQRMGEPGLLFCYEVQSSRHRYPVSAHGRNRKRETYHRYF